jgi:hypothetical protein
MSNDAALEIKTAESVAFDLATRISNYEDLDNSKGDYRKKLLDLYSECLSATLGHRDID